MKERKLPSRLLSGFLNGICLFTVLAILVRITIRDLWHFPGLFCYMTPLPLLVLGGAVCFLASAASKASLRTFLCAVVLVITIPWLIAQEFRSTEAELTIASTNQPLKVLFWNVARRESLAATLDVIEEVDADVVGLVELTGNPKERRVLLKERFPQYDISVLGSNMYLLAKGESGESVPRQLGGNSAARAVEVQIRGERWQVLLIDIDSDLKRSRSRDLRMIAEICEDYANQNLIVLGDFNTPVDSLHYASLRRSHRELFESAGRGYGPTWPAPFPVLRLDQMWFNSHVTPVGYRKVTTLLSDHCAIEGVFTVNRDVRRSDESAW